MACFHFTHFVPRGLQWLKMPKSDSVRVFFPPSKVVVQKKKTILSKLRYKGEGQSLGIEGAFEWYFLFLKKSLTSASAARGGWSACWGAAWSGSWRRGEGGWSGKKEKQVSHFPIFYLIFIIKSFLKLSILILPIDSLIFFPDCCEAEEREEELRWKKKKSIPKYPRSIYLQKKKSRVSHKYGTHLTARGKRESGKKRTEIGGDRGEEKLLNTKRMISPLLLVGALRKKHLFIN